MVATRRSLAASSRKLVGDGTQNLSPSPSTTTPIITSNKDAIPVTPSPKKKRQRKYSSPSPSKKSTKQRQDLVFKRQDVGRIAPQNPFVDLKIAPNELRPSATLTTGQCFHWRVVGGDDDDLESSEQQQQQTSSAWGTHDATEWVGVLRTRIRNQDDDDAIITDDVVLSIKETTQTTLYRVLHGPSDLDYPQLLRDYFQVQFSLQDLYEEWSRQCPKRLARIAKCIPGVRIVEQDPWECLVSFLCSSNNNIPRITKMLNAIRETYGKKLVTIGGHNNETATSLYSFPSHKELLSRMTDKDLRSLCGMGYRAKYLMETSQLLQKLGGEAYLWKLRNETDSQMVQDALIQFCGVGRKVADCVALFSLRQDCSIPVDVHVWNIALRDYDEDGVLKEAKSLTPTIYKQTGDLFRDRFSIKPGWAHSLLFVAELPSFRPTLPVDLVVEMDKFREEEQERKKAKKKAK